MIETYYVVSYEYWYNNKLYLDNSFFITIDKAQECWRDLYEFDKYKDEMVFGILAKYSIPTHAIFMTLLKIEKMTVEPIDYNPFT